MTFAPPSSSIPPQEFFFPGDPIGYPGMTASSITGLAPILHR